MDEKKILSKFIKNPAQKILLDLIKNSIYFNAEEKFYLIKDLPNYTAEQIKKLANILNSEYEANKPLEEKYPDKFKEKKILRDRNWQIVLDAIEKELKENKK